MVTLEISRLASIPKTALPAPGLIGKSTPKTKSSNTPDAIDYFAEFATLPVREDEVDLMSDPQEQYDEDLQEYTSGEILGRPGEVFASYDSRFRNDFFRYSREFQDRDGGAPGIDQDFGTVFESRDPDRPVRARSEGSMDDRVREEILDLFTRDRGLAADDVTAQVEDGLVTLTGTVLDSEMKNAIEEAVQTVPGVEGVENRLELD